MDPRLAITTVGYVLSLVFTLSIAIFVFVKGKDKRLTTTFFLMNIAIAVFEFSHVWGINIADGVRSRHIFLLNLANIFISIFVAHWVLELIGIVKKRIVALAIIYVSGIALFIFYILYPDTFLLPSVPKMYLPSYYVPGSLYWLMRVYFAVVGFYFMAELIVAYSRSQDPILKNRFRYAFWGVIYGFVVGSMAVFLVYDIPVDPLWSMFFSLYTVPFAYAILKYDLMDIRVVAKRALLYALSVGAVSVLISFLSFSNQWAASQFPGFPLWILPFVSSIIAVSITIFIWRKFRESDILKYEFITIITHKFRTPLTRIKWSTDNLLSRAAADTKEELEDIAYSTRSLVDLTNTLVSLSNSEFTLERYNFEHLDLVALVHSLVERSLDRARRKNLTINQVGDGPVFAKVDKEKISFVIQTLLDNAIAYTPADGVITLSLSQKGKDVLIEVRDNGIGIDPQNLPLVFTKFFRTPNAKAADTEGLGIGLYTSNIIAERHGGRVSVASEGIGKGSTFSVIIPA